MKAQNVGRLSRGIGSCAGAAVAGFGVLALLALLGVVHLPGLSSGAAAPTATAAAALGAAGVALQLLASSDIGAPRRVTGQVLAGIAAATGISAVRDGPTTALAIMLAAVALAAIDAKLPLGRTPLRVADPLLAVTAIIAVVAPLPRLTGTAPDPDGVMSPSVAVAVLALVGGTVLARSGPTPLPAAVLPHRREFADTLLQSMNEAVMVLDGEQRVLDVNRRWREMTGHRTEDAVGRRPPYPWAPDTDAGEGVVHRVDGTAVPVLATMAAVPGTDGHPRAYVATYVDIADRKRAEQALTERAVELETSNGQLRESNRRLETALAFKNDLMSMLSHDMAQPVSSIASLAELLTSDWSDLPDDIRLELATKIDRNTSRLIRMMNDLSLLFRLDAGSVTARPTPVPLREVAENAVGDLDAEGVDIDVDAEVSVLADRGHLRQVLQNLLTNAVRYGGTPILVQARRHGDRVQIVVQDSGPGIPDELVPKLFDRFMRGAGLGLFIVRHLVEANGGSVRYERGEPHGARLVVELEAGKMTVPDAANGTGDPS